MTRRPSITSLAGLGATALVLFACQGQGAFNAINAKLIEMDRRFEKVSDDHEARLRRLEAWSYALPVSLVLAIGSVGTSLFLAFKG